jgi:hypothetical protein
MAVASTAAAALTAEDVSVERLERSLRLAYTKEDFAKTKLFASIVSWEDVHSDTTSPTPARRYAFLREDPGASPSISTAPSIGIVIPWKTFSAASNATAESALVMKS